jgi:hypothetical protein
MFSQIHHNFPLALNQIKSNQIKSKKNSFPILYQNQPTNQHDSCSERRREMKREKEVYVLVMERFSFVLSFLSRGGARM